MEQNRAYVKTELGEDEIWFISREEFLKRLNKVEKYRQAKLALEEAERSSFYDAKMPIRLLKMTMENYGLIGRAELEVSQEKSRWIFFTGPNGSGKTSVLRAIGGVLGNRVFMKSDLRDGSLANFEARFDLLYKGAAEPFTRKGNEETAGDFSKPMVKALAMYGPYCLDVINSSISTTEFQKKLGKRESFKSLFSEGEKLLSIDKQFAIWRIKNPQRFEKLEYYIRSVFTDIVPNLVNIKFEKDARGHKKTTYVFVNEENGSEEELVWEELSSGSKSVFALLGDIMIRLYHYQKQVYDPSELTGVVIVDEIDLHLHPQAQKKLILDLSKTFRQVQFIVSTHSPIPFLGAPTDSSFFNVYRTNGNKIAIAKLDMTVNQLMPNTLLTSPLFGFTEIANPEYDEMSYLKNEDSYDEAIFYSIIDKKINKAFRKARNEKD